MKPDRAVTVREMAEVLYRSGAERVWLFGSLAQGRPQDRLGDIDLAVRGLRGAAFDSARKAVIAISPCKVDVLAIEQAPPTLRWAIGRDGQLVPRAPEAGSVTPLPQPTRVGSGLQHERVGAIAAQIAARGATRVLDLGCGRGDLIERLWTLAGVEQVTGVDFDDWSLVLAERRMRGLRTRGSGPAVRLVRGLVTNDDPRYHGHDVVVACEVIEHLDPAPLDAFAAMVFGVLRPSAVLVTTPNADCNPAYDLQPDRMRHPDHRFEWGREGLRAWVAAITNRHAYSGAIGGIGAEVGGLGRPTQLAAFDRIG